MFPARIAIVTALEQCLGATGSNCNSFEAKLRLFGKASSASPSSLTLNDISGQTVDVLHPGENTIEQNDQVIVGQTVDERWIVLPSGTSSGTGHPRIQFVTTGKIADRRVNAKVLRVQSNAPNLVEGGILVYGDQVTLHDPFRMWSDIEEGATGWAYMAYEQQDDGSTTEIDEAHTDRYEIEECTLPIRKLEGRLAECLWNGSGNPRVLLSENLGDGVGDIRSNYPEIDKLPDTEITAGQEPGSPPKDYQYIDCANTYGLDAVAGSYCTIERMSNRQPSDPENYTTPLARSSDSSPTWIVTSVEKKYARHIKVLKGESGWTKTDHFDGYWPQKIINDPLPITGCEPSIVDDDGMCLSTGDIGYAFFDSLTGDYQLYSTNSAFYGEPKEVDVVTDAEFSDCTLGGSKSSIKVFCDPVAGGELSGGSIPLSTETVASYTTIGIEGGCSECIWQYLPIEEPCGPKCAWEWDAASLGWRRATGDPDCPNNCTCDPPDLPENIATIDDGEAGPNTDCYNDNGQAKWYKVQSCTGGCTCDENTYLPPDAQIYDEIRSPCEGAAENKQLCVTTQLKDVVVVDCSGGGGGSSSSPGSTKSCIPIETECPDACENPV